MKKYVLFLLLILVLNLLSFSNYRCVSAENDILDLNASSYCLMEPISKSVIIAKNEHKKLYPASMTKMMGLYLVLEAIDNNEISLEDQVIVSGFASSMGGTQIFLEENEKMSVQDLLKSVAINSANDAIVALGEHLCSSNALFVEKMNKKAKEFGMNDTNFVNATGFDDENHYSSSYDMALLGSYLVGFDDKILKYSSMEEGYIREDTSSPFWLVNTNKLLKYYEGMDGLKTGFTTKAGYNLTATAKRSGVRLVSTVMNLDTIQHRSQDTIRLLDYGFSRLQCLSIFEKNDVITIFEIDKMMNLKLEAIIKQDVRIIVDKNENQNDIDIKVNLSKISDSYIKDEIIGEVIITTKSNKRFVYTLYAGNDVKKQNFFSYLLNFLHLIFI